MVLLPLMLVQFRYRSWEEGAVVACPHPSSTMQVRCQWLSFSFHPGGLGSLWTGVWQWDIQGVQAGSRRSSQADIEVGEAEPHVCSHPKLAGGNVKCLCKVLGLVAAGGSLLPPLPPCFPWKSGGFACCEQLCRVLGLAGGSDYRGRFLLSVPSPQPVGDSQGHWAGSKNI